jgi:AcrR family transcriptional regulator
MPEPAGMSTPGHTKRPRNASRRPPAPSGTSCDGRTAHRSPRSQCGSRDTCAMPAVAAASGVAVQTVYFTFRTKGDLLQAVYERAVLGPAGVPPHRMPWWPAADDGHQIEEPVRRLAEGTVELLTRAAALVWMVLASKHPLRAPDAHPRPRPAPRADQPAAVRAMHPGPRLGHNRVRRLGHHRRAGAGSSGSASHPHEAAAHHPAPAKAILSAYLVTLHDPPEARIPELPAPIQRYGRPDSEADAGDEIEVDV